MSEKKRKCIFVIGMHRSGTSAMAGALHQLGIPIGKDIMAPNEYNEKGYFENNKVYHLNDEIFEFLGVNWHTTYLLEENWYDRQDLEPFKDRIVQVVNEEFANEELFLIKDPRISILAPIWIEVFEGLGIEMKWICTIRNPKDVLASLERAHKLSPIYGSTVWLDYYFGCLAIHIHQDIHVLPIFFSDLIKKGDVLVDEIMHYLEIVPTQNSREDLNFISEDLRHHHSDKFSKTFGPIEGLTKELWNLLNRWNNDEFSLKLKAKCEYLRREFHHIIRELVQFRHVHNEDYETAMTSTSQRLYAEITHLNDALAEYIDENNELDESLKLLQQRNQDQSLRFAQLEEEVITFRKQLRSTLDRVNQISDGQFPLTEGLNDLSQSKDGLISLETYIADLQGELLRLGKNLSNTQADNQILREKYDTLSFANTRLKQRNDEIESKWGYRLHLVLNSWIERLSTGLQILIRLLVMLPRIVSAIITHPGKALEALNLHNFKRLIFAIQTEHFGTVLTNFKRFFDEKNFVISNQEATIPPTGFDPYQEYVRKSELTSGDIIAARTRVKNLPYHPRISIVTPTFNTNPDYLRKCAISVKAQVYENWEWCIYDDASTSNETIKTLKEIAKSDERVKLTLGTENHHISYATNMALRSSTGEFVGFLDHDDELTIDALYRVVEVINAKDNVSLIYSDEDKLDEQGLRCDPHFKSDFNLDLLLCHNYICHFVVVRKSIGNIVSWLRTGFEGAQDYDFLLRIISHCQEIVHIPRILYHWRKSETSTAGQLSNKDYVEDASVRALNDYMLRNKIRGTVERGMFNGSWRIKRELVSDTHFVSIIIPFKDEVDLLRSCIESILEKTMYSNYEIVLVNNNSQELETFQYLDRLDRSQNIRVLDLPIPFNFSKINNFAVGESHGDVLLFLNNDTEVITKGWLIAMLEHIQRDEVGAVGAKLLYPDGTIQHAGVVLGIGGVAAHVHNNIPSRQLSYFGRNNIIQNLSACTAACLMVKKEVFEKVGGFEEEGLKIAFNDVDLCVKIRQLGYLITYTPYCELYHYESKSRGYEDTPEKVARFNSEIEFFVNRWEKVLEDGDPYYNRNLTLDRTDFGIKLS